MVKNKETAVAPAAESDDCELTEEERQRRKDRFWEAVERIGERNKDLDPDEELAFITEVVEEVRQERYERAQARAKNGC